MLLRLSMLKKRLESLWIIAIKKAVVTKLDKTTLLTRTEKVLLNSQDA